MYKFVTKCPRCGNPLFVERITPSGFNMCGNTEDRKDPNCCGYLFRVENGKALPISVATAKLLTEEMKAVHEKALFGMGLYG